MAAPATSARSVLADQVKERLLEEILERPLPRRTRGSSRRRSPASWAPARRRSARRSAASRRSASSRSRRSAAPASAGRPAARSSRPTRSGRRSRRSAARLAVPRMTDDDLDELVGARRRDARPRRATTTAHGSPRPTPGSTAGSSSSPTTRTLEKRLALARAVLADLHHARRARCRPAVVGRPPRPDPRGAPSAGT